MLACLPIDPNIIFTCYTLTPVVLLAKLFVQFSAFYPFCSRHVYNTVVYC